MNESIEDEKGHMSKVDFKKMFYTAFGKKQDENKKLIFNMLLPLI